MPEIRQLSPSVVNKIAAGEVIERPASVVKELMENAVDAGAKRVDVTVEQGGVELVRVVDDGCGISADQLPLAIAAHATSKIREADDLFRVGTLGFRGEALASIAEVSKLILRSRPIDATAGAEISVHGGRIEPVAPCGCPIGTTIEVHNLFFNTPVRRKFLRTTATEMGHTAEAFTRIALAYPHVQFTLRHHEKLVHELPAAPDCLARIGAFFGSELADSMIPVESSDGPVVLRGYVAHPSQTRSHAKMQYVFLNGRAIRDRALQHALSEAYRGLILTGRYPIAFLQIDMPPDAVDVNVHPTKLEVRFQDSGRLYSQLLSTLRTKFLSVDLNNKLRPVAAAPDQGMLAATSQESPGADPTEAADPQQAAKQRAELVAWAKGELAAQTSLDFRPSQPSSLSSYSLDQPEHKPLELVRIDRPPRLAEAAPRPQPAPMQPHIGPSADARSAKGVPRRPAPAIQVHNRYLIAETDDGMAVIDQHALHERILYEQLRERVLAGTMETQRLLVPEAVDLSPAEAAAALSSREILSQLGMEVSEFGGDTILVTSYPAMLANFKPADVLRDLVARILSGGKTPDIRDLVDDLLHMIACKAAIKAGDRLTPEEVAALVEQRHLAQDSHHCPHGRPTALVFTREELDRQFLRT